MSCCNIHANIAKYQINSILLLFSCRICAHFTLIYHSYLRPNYVNHIHNHLPNFHIQTWSLSLFIYFFLYQNVFVFPFYYFILFSIYIYTLYNVLFFRLHIPSAFISSFFLLTNSMLKFSTFYLKFYLQYFSCLRGPTCIFI